MACVCPGIMSHSMDCRTIPHRRTPHAPELFLQYVEDFSRVTEFYAHPPTLPAALRYARKLKFPKEQRRSLAEILREQNTAFGSGRKAMKNLERLEQDAVAVVSGQQVGLFSGPAYSIYKALTAIEVAEEISRAGVPAVPVFWLATEDHDLAEVNKCLWLHDDQLTRFELPDGESSAPTPSGKPVGNIVLGPQVEVLVRDAVTKVSGPGADAVAEMLQASYTASDTYGSAFGKLFARLFQEHGLILLDPLDARVHRLAAPLLQRALEERDLLNEKLLARGRELGDAGFDPQVKITSRSALLFYMEGGIRHALTVQNNRYHAGDAAFSRDELLHSIHAQPESFSPNVLLRPVVQDFLLHTAAYIAGPAEIAYYAQSEVLYRHLLKTMPVIFPRASFTIVEPKLAKLLSRYNLSVEDVWAGREKLRARLESEFLPATLARQFDQAAASLDRELSRLKEPLHQLDPSLDGALETAHRKMTYQLENLREKAGRAREQREKVISKHEEILTAALYPDRVAQQRALCLLPLLAHWGLEGLEELRKLASVSLRKGHEVIVSL